jgi:hypothetical protein
MIRRTPSPISLPTSTARSIPSLTHHLASDRLVTGDLSMLNTLPPIRCALISSWTLRAMSWQLSPALTQHSNHCWINMHLAHPCASRPVCQHVGTITSAGEYEADYTPLVAPISSAAYRQTTVGMARPVDRRSRLYQTWFTKF